MRTGKFSFTTVCLTGKATGDIDVNVESFENSFSRIEATGKINGKASHFTNNAYELKTIKRTTTYAGVCSDITGDYPGHLGRCRDNWQWPAWISEEKLGESTTLGGRISSHSQVDLAAITLVNQSVESRETPGGQNNAACKKAAAKPLRRHHAPERSCPEALADGDVDKLPNRASRGRADRR